MATNWDARFLALAREVATWSKDPRHKVGAVAVSSKGQVLSQGYNGFPRGIADSASRYSNGDTKRLFVVHAEQNVIYNATYTGVSLNGATLYIAGLPPCHECAKGIIQTGIRRIVIDNDQAGGWEASWNQSQAMFKEVGIEVCVYLNSLA